MQDNDHQRPSTCTEDNQQLQEQTKRQKLDPQGEQERTTNSSDSGEDPHHLTSQNQNQVQYQPNSDPDQDDPHQLAAFDGEDVSGEPLELSFSWRNSNFKVSLEGMVTIKDLKAVIYSVTSVQPERQKILGLVVGQIPADDVLLSTLEFKLKKGIHFKLLGTPEEEAITRPEDLSTLSQSGSQAIPKCRQSDCVLYMPRVRAKLDELSANLELNMMNPPRSGKKLLVLDLDVRGVSFVTLNPNSALRPSELTPLFKLFDLNDEIFLDMARPYLHEFLTTLWPYYDICIWSATNWRWLESKLVELGMVDGSRSNQYLIQFVLDRRTMFEVTSMRHGKISKHEVKALELIWRKVPAYNETNTVHLDDLSRNFALNPKSGVKISAFKNARANKHDRQLIFLARYFLQISSLEDVRLIDHKKWQDCKLPLPEHSQDPLEILSPSDPELVKFKSHHSESKQP